MNLSNVPSTPQSFKPLHPISLLLNTADIWSNSSACAAQAQHSTARHSTAWHSPSHLCTTRTYDMTQQATAQHSMTGAYMLDHELPCELRGRHSPVLCFPLAMWHNPMYLVHLHSRQPHQCCLLSPADQHAIVFCPLFAGLQCRQTDRQTDRQTGRQAGGRAGTRTDGQKPHLLSSVRNGLDKGLL